MLTHPDTGVPICAAKTRHLNRFGEYVCLSPPMKNGSGRCRMHGGASLRGAQHPNANTLEHSKYLPERLASRYDDMRADPALLTLTHEVALIRTRLSELLERIDDGFGSGALQRIDTAFTTLRKAMAAQDEAGTQDALIELGDSIRAVRDDWSVWADIYRTINLLIRTTESERKRLVEGNYMVKMDEVMTFVGAVAGILRETIKDRETITIIQNKMQRLLEASYGNERN